MGNTQWDTLFEKGFNKWNRCIITQCPAEFLKIHWIHVDTSLLTRYGYILSVFLYADKRSCFNIIVPPILNKILNCLSGCRTLLNFIKYYYRFPIFQHNIVNSL